MASPSYSPPPEGAPGQPQPMSISAITDGHIAQEHHVSQASNTQPPHVNEELQRELAMQYYPEAFKARVQELIDQKILSFVNVPNVANNPLPGHGGLTVNALEGADEGLVKGVSNVKASMKVVRAKLSEEGVTKVGHNKCKKAKNLYANNIQRMYASVRNLDTLQINDQDLSEYLTRAQSTIDGLKLMLVIDDIMKMLGKLDNMFMVFLLHGISKECSLVKDQSLINTTIPTVEKLIDCRVQAFLPSDDTHITLKSYAFVSNFTNGGCGGRGRGQVRGRRGRSNLCSTHCMKDGHTQDRCFDLHGYPNKTANVSQTTSNCESKGELEATFFADEYQEYLRLKSSPLSSSLTFVIDESPTLLNRYGITYEIRLRPHDSALIPSASTPALAPSPDLPFAICKDVSQKKVVEKVAEPPNVKDVVAELEKMAV
ncbi:hypothetical protein KIW84_075059 [Lathyrus oleraceus]|uniref:Uncharacterized protein n=1 Tax=Pisum sativum TaxID=3888 RepID=A0A9D4VSS5_PEA|nr:hypothetical protein KIW84_075059 [Pisum sativum]